MSTLHLHAGIAKSGTTWLQRVLAHNREALRAGGVLYPGRGQSHFLASLDLREAGFGQHRYPGAEGAWPSVLEQAARHRGDVLVSHESLAQLTTAEVRRVVADAAPRDLHLVLTVRDPGRQLPAVWQERVKNRSDQGWHDFLRGVDEAWAEGRPPPRAAYWRSQDVLRVLRTFDGLARVTVVTVPLRGAEPEVLWRRFARACGFADLEVDLEVGHGNASMGRLETEVLRAVNRQLPADLRWRRYEKRIKNGLVPTHLAGRAEAGRIVVPEWFRPRAEEYAAHLRAALADAGVDLVGDLDDLLPSYGSDQDVEPDVTDVQVAAVRLVADLLVARQNN